MRILTFALLLLAALVALLHVAAPAPLENAQNAVRPHAPYAVGPAATALHASLAVADLHSDALLWKRDLNRRADRGHVDFPRLREGNVALQVFTATTKSPKGQNYARNGADTDNITLLAMAQLWPPRTWDSLLERALYQGEKLSDFAAASESQVRLVRWRGDLEAVMAARRGGSETLAAIYGIEGAHPLEGEIANLDRLFDAGLRVIGLTHFFDNELGGSLHGQSGAGLTEFGRAVVKAANAKNLVIDVAHASPQMVREVLELSTRPVILSHGGVKAACDTPRNLEDELMRTIAARGGLVGIGFWDAAACDISPPGVVKSIRHAIDLLGLEHVALGSDYDGATEVAFDASELAVLTQTMLDEGFTEREIRAVMGGNAIAFFLENLPR